MNSKKVATVKLENTIISANTGADAIKRAPIVEEDTGIRCLRIGDISNNRPFSEWGFTKAEDSVINKFLLKQNDIIIARTGNTIGVVKYIEKNLNSVYNNGLIRVKVDTSKYYPKYIFYNLVSKRFRDFVYGISGGTSTQPNMKISHTLKFEILDFPLEEQKNIANILSVIDEKIETNNQINQKLEEMAQTIFKYWFDDFEFPNNNGEPYKSSGGELIESELGMIPIRWVVNTLGNIVELSTKSVNPQKHPKRLFEHFSIPALDNNKMSEMQYGEEIKSNKYIISDKTVLISKLNPTTKRIWKPFPQGKYPICSTEFIVYVPKEEKILSYVYELINSNTFSEMLVSHATGSTGSRQRVKPSDTLNFKFLLPPIEVMNDFSKVIEPIHKNISLRIIENQKLSLIRDTLLPKLMSGEIRVPLEK